MRQSKSRSKSSAAEVPASSRTTASASESERPARSRPSIQDVAALASVSTATVSRVVNNPTLVSSSTAERVQRAIAELGYQPNRLAQALMTRRSRILGLSLPDFHGEFYAELLRGADREARACGYRLMVTSAALGDAAPAGVRGAFDHAEGLLDGIAVMLTESGQHVAEAAATAGVPAVVLDSQVDLPGVDTVRIDNRSGTTEAVEQLIASTPPERCFFVGGPPGNFDTQERVGAFRRVIRREGGPPRRDQIVYGDFDAETGRAWATEAAAGGHLVGSAVLAANDDVAIGILQAAQALGLDAPRDVAIVGCDDARVTTIIRPTLSTVAVPRADFGRAAVEALVRRIEEPEASVRQVRLPTALVVRESSVRESRNR